MLTGMIRSLFILLTLALLGLQTSWAHPTIVLGTLEAEPRTPQAGEQVTLSLAIEFPTQFPVEDAVVYAEFYPLGVDPEGDAEPLARKRLAEGDTPGRYRGALTLTDEGPYQLLLRDRTYPWEDTTARLEFAVGSGENPEAFDFIFPPTVGAPRNLTTWLIWLVGVPAGAGVLVTVLVLTGRKGKEQDSQPAS